MPKLHLTPSLNLDLTVNPDFSQVDVDQQVINLSRYELFFPEKRQFFLGERRPVFQLWLFGYHGHFFQGGSGLTQPIDFGARMTGKLDKDWRIGAMDIQTGTFRLKRPDAGKLWHHYPAAPRFRPLQYRVYVRQ